jgi:hypothetical protein
VRTAAALTIGALALGLGAVVVGHAVAVPTLSASELVDANLARALVAPLRLRVADVLLASTVVLALTAHRWLADRLVGVAAALVVVLAAADRVFVLPRLARAGGRVDFVARRPHDQLELVETLTVGHAVLVAAVGAVLVFVLVAAVRRTASPTV